jgi:choline dehydrogenase
MSALRSLIKIGRSGALARFLDKPFKPDRHDDEDALAGEIRENTQMLYHPVGSARWAPASTPSSNRRSRSAAF